MGKAVKGSNLCGGRYRSVAGGLIFIAAIVLLMGIVTAEAVHPGYHVGENTISSLASSEPSATVFNLTMILAGVLFIAGSLLFDRCEFKWWMTLSTLLMGAGAIGVGLFPYYTGTPHLISAALAFGAGSIAAILSGLIVKGPFKWIAVTLGVIGLGGLTLFAITWSTEIYGPLGEGGIERWAAYPVILWSTGFGGYLMGATERSRP